MVNISIIIPAYNEEKRIAPTLEEYSNYFKKIYKDFEILVILNGCKDNTLGIVKKHQKKHPLIKYKDFREPIGKGGAIIEGFKLAQGDLIGFSDADNSTKPKAFHDLILNLKDYDGIIASRWIKGAKINIKQSLLRRVASRGFNILVRLFFNIPLRDTQCGSKLFKKHAIKKITNKLGITKWAFDIDLLYLLKKNGFRIKEIPTEWHHSVGTKFNLKKHVPEMFLSIARLRLLYSPFNMVVKVYDWVFGNG